MSSHRTIRRWIRPSQRLTSGEIVTEKKTQKTDIDDVYPLSPLQEGILFHDLSESEPGIFVTQFVCSMKTIDEALFREAWNRIVDRHAILRTAFAYQNLANPLQLVGKHVIVPWERHDFSRISESEATSRFQSHLCTDREQGFILSRAPLMRFSWVRFPGGSHRFVWTHHHILLDGWSIGALLQEVFEAYLELRDDRRAVIRERAPFKEYVKFVLEHSHEDAERYWRRRLSGISGPTELDSGGFASEKSKLSGHHSEQLILDSAQTKSITQFAAAQKLTINSVIQGAWAVLLSRYAREQDVLFGVTVSGRSTEVEGVESMIGLLVNTLPMRVQVDAKMALGDWLQQLQSDQLESLTFDFTPLTCAQRWSGFNGDLPLISSLVVFENFPLELELWKAAGELEVTNPETISFTNYPLALIVEPGESMSLRIAYDASRFSTVMAREILCHLKLLLTVIPNYLTRPIAELPLLSSGEHVRLIENWNDTAVRKAEFACVQDFVAAQAQRTPDRTAIVMNADCMSYECLDDLANGLGQRLSKLGVGPDVTVGICSERSIESLIAILAILKAGGCYVPLDPDFPLERLQYMLEDSGAIAVLAYGTKAHATVAKIRGERMVIDLEGVVSATQRGASPPRSGVSADHLAYVMYTSGSTGNPKGVALCHRTLVNLLEWNHATMGSAPRILQFATMSFDASFNEIFSALSTGGSIILIDDDSRTNPVELAATICDHGIERTILPVVFMHRIAELPNESLEDYCVLKDVVVTGEQLHVTDAIRRTFAISVTARLHNHYGPSETHVVSAYTLDAESSGWSSRPPIGRPIFNTQMYVLGTHLEVQPIGKRGDLYISGDSLARGYLNQPGLTAERFVPNPFCKRGGSRMYLSGDVVRHGRQGELEFCERRDTQVKIRGYRVEPDEIEVCLGNHPSISAAAVLAIAASVDHNKLVAFVVCDTDLSDTDEIRKFLQGKLPPYMVPSDVLILDSLPLTPTGKIDRGVLRRSVGTRPTEKRAYVAPRNETEKVLAATWARILALERVGVTDNFFDLGGDSLVAIRLLSALRSEADIDVSMRVLLEYPSVARLAEVVMAPSPAGIREKKEETQLIARREERFKPFPLTPLQEAYWVGRHGAFEIGNVAAHTYTEIETSNLDLDRFQWAFRELIERHEMLRIVLTSEGDQQVLEKVPSYCIATQDLRGASDGEVSLALTAVRDQMSHHVHPVEEWPLFEVRATLLDGGITRLHLGFDVLLVDGPSIWILNSDLQRLYENSLPLTPPSKLSFRDYVLTEQQTRNSAAFRSAREYWHARIDDMAAAPALPLAKSPSLVDRPVFERRGARLESSVWRSIKENAKHRGLTPSGMLLAAYGEILGRWSAESCFTINTTLFNRTPIHPDVNETVGNFTSVTLVEMDRDLGSSFEERAHRIQEDLWTGIDHRCFSGVEVLRELSRKTDWRGGTAAPVVFTSVLGLPHREGSASDFRWLGEVVYSIGQTPQIWLDCQVYEENSVLVCNWESVVGLFPDGMLEEMFNDFMLFVERLAMREWPEAIDSILPSAQSSENRQLDSRREEVRLSDLVAAGGLFGGSRSAIVTGCTRLTYHDVESQSDCLAARLSALGASSGQLVAIVMKPGWEQVVAALAIIKTGAAYVPVAPTLPQKRIVQLLERCDCSVAVIQPDIESTLVWPEGIERLTVETAVSPGKEILPNAQRSADDLAYVIHTSGSTGVPKGVMIDHRGAVNTILDINKKFSVNERDVIFALSLLSFDLSVYDIFGTMAAGAKMVIPDPDRQRDPAHWAERMQIEGVTLWNSVPALMEMLVEYLEGRPADSPTSLRLVLLSGDWIPLNLPDRIRALFPGVRIISLGGATEVSIWSIFHEIGEIDPEWKSIPYGRALSGQTVQVLHTDLTPAPAWVPGQICIGGAGLALGYWRDDEATRTKFVNHPTTGKRVYLTGDRGRLLPNGEIEFLGREDNQIKIRGHRIELGEIESALVRHPRIEAAVVTAVGPEKRRKERLLAYVVPSADTANGQRLRHPFPANDQGCQERDESNGMTDAADFLHFKLSQRGVRTTNQSDPIVSLGSDVEEEVTRKFVRRRTHRRFRQDPIARNEFGALLASLRQFYFDGYPLPKYQYPSAGSLYPVQTYLYVKPDRVCEISSGTYYYHPRKNGLIPLHLGVKLDRNSQFPSNRPIFEEAAFAIFLICQDRAIEPMYGEWARALSLVEAGYMGQLLMTEAPSQNIGLCPIGRVEFECIRSDLNLDPGQFFLHGLLGGRIDPQDVEGVDSLIEEGHKIRELIDLIQISESSQTIDPASNSRKSENSAEDLGRSIRAYLAETLPEYMIPSTIVTLDAMPLTATGKINRSALPEPPAEEVPPAPRGELDTESHSSELEVMIADTWKAVLGRDRLGRDESFFDLGGNSVAMIRVHRKLCAVLERDIPIVELFRLPTIRLLAEGIANSEPADRGSSRRMEGVTVGRERLRRRRSRSSTREDG